ncbi:MAG: YceI family protein [Dermatophilaceae bacterium]
MSNAYYLNTNRSRWTLTGHDAIVTLTVTNWLFTRVTATAPITEATMVAGESGEPLAVSARIDLDRFESGNAQRDRHVRGSGFLDTARNPTARYESTAVVAIADGSWTVDGNLTVGTVSAPVTLAVTATPRGTKREKTWRFTVVTSVSRRAVGVASMPHWIVGDMVDVEFDVVLERGSTTLKRSDPKAGGGGPTDRPNTSGLA